MVVLVMFYLGGVKWWVNCSLIMLGLAGHHGAAALRV